MKKSKAINAIAKKFGPDNPTLDVDSLLDFLVNKLKLLPPYSKSTVHYCECGCKGRCELGHEWEEED